MRYTSTPAFSARSMVVLIIAAFTAPLQASLLTLDNGTIKVSVDTSLGGTITYLSQSGSGTNLVNRHDPGRDRSRAGRPGDGAAPAGDRGKAAGQTG